jgi:hypothetical protein
MEKCKCRVLKLLNKTKLLGKGFLCVWAVFVFGLLCACVYDGSLIPPPAESAGTSTCEHTPEIKVSPTPVPAEACEDKINASGSYARVGAHLEYL